MISLHLRLIAFACVACTVIVGCGDREPGPSRPYGANIFVRGNLFDGKEAESWSICDNTNCMARIGDYNYELLIPLKARTFSLKIGDKTWKAVNLGAPGSGATLKPGESVGLIFSDGAGNIDLQIVRDGIYRFSLDAGNRLHPILTVAETSDLSH
jgi:hypothetical protein